MELDDRQYLIERLAIGLTGLAEALGTPAGRDLSFDDQGRMFADAALGLIETLGYQIEKCA